MMYTLTHSSGFVFTYETLADALADLAEMAGNLAEDEFFTLEVAQATFFFGVNCQTIRSIAPASLSEHLHKLVKKIFLKRD